MTDIVLMGNPRVADLPVEEIDDDLVDVWGETASCRTAALQAKLDDGVRRGALLL